MRRVGQEVLTIERALGVYDAAADPELAKEAWGSGLSHTPPILGILQPICASKSNCVDEHN